MKSVEISAKKVEDAISQGLVELRATIDDVKVEIIDTGGLFKKAKVRLTLNEDEEKRRQKAAAQRSQEAPVQQPQKTKPEPVQKEKSEQPQKTKPVPVQKTDPEQNTRPAQHNVKAEPQHKVKAEAQQKIKAEPPKKAKNEQPQKPKTEQPQKSEQPKSKPDPEFIAKACEFISQTVKLMGITADVSCIDDNEPVINIDAKSNEGIVIGYRGETLGALQYITQLAMRVNEEKFMRLTLDCNGFRARREQTLINLAKRTADRCVKSGRKVKLEPMDRNDRRTIHTALSEDKRIVTKSEGDEPYRHIIVFPKRNKNYEK